MASACLGTRTETCKGDTEAATINMSANECIKDKYALSVELTSLHAMQILTNVYGPCTSDRKRAFTHWLKNIQTPPDVDRLLVGDFNLIREPENRNKPWRDLTETFLFNEAISALDLVEIPLLGRLFTWTNKQFAPLLERMDWIFTSNSWTLSYPISKAWPW